MNKNLTPAAFLALVNKTKRTDADIRSASAYLQRSAYQRALWLDVRIASDGADGATVAEEAGVTAGRVSQIRYALNKMRDAGVPFPTTVAEADASEGTYLHLTRVYKSGKAARERIAAAVKRAEGIADVDGKHAVLSAVVPDTADDNKRAARPNDGTSATADDDTDGQNTGAPAVGGAAPTERESTLVERMRAVLADIQGGPVADIETVMTLANQISDAIAARADALV